MRKRKARRPVLTLTSHYKLRCPFLASYGKYLEGDSRGRGALSEDHVMSQATLFLVTRVWFARLRFDGADRLVMALEVELESFWCDGGGGGLDFGGCL